MNSQRKTTLSCIILLVLASTLAIVIYQATGRRSLQRVNAAESASKTKPADEAKRAHLNEAFGKLPLYFIENRGQTDGRVAFYLQGRDKTVYFTPEGVTFSLLKTKAESVSERALDQRARLSRDAENAERYTVKLNFVGANPHVRPAGLEQSEAVFSYFTGAQNQWKAGLKSYAKIVYTDLWPGIDLVYAGTVNRMKYTFIVKPGADPKQIRLAYRGVSSVRLNEAGELEVNTPVESLKDDQPVSHQMVNGQQVKIGTAYTLNQKADSGSVEYGFTLNAYDRSRELVIDPALLVYCGYIGGAGGANADPEKITGVAVDTAGNAYVAGSTSDFYLFPVTVGSDVTDKGGRSEAFYAKVNAQGTALVYCGFIGGSGADYATGIGIDSSGNAYVAGYTDSTEASFPVKGGPDLTYGGGAWDGFVAKVNATGTALVYCGYIGGNGADFIRGVAVDDTGNAYVGGHTSSMQPGFPVRVGPDLTYNGGQFDGFVAKLNTTGTLIYCGYVGGSSDDVIRAIAVDEAGNAYLGGDTNSNENSFPVIGGLDRTFNGGPGDSDGFVAKVNSTGTALVYCGYIGGKQFDFIKGLALDNAGNAYVAGETDSNETSDGFPVKVGPDLNHHGNSRDAFVAKVNAAGSALIYCGYLGGQGTDYATAIAVDGSGSAYLTGYTDSPSTSFPVKQGPDLTQNGNSDVFVAKVNTAGTDFIYCGYIGGDKGEFGNGIAVDSTGSAYVVGGTNSSETSFPVKGAFDLTYNGGSGDGFIAKVNPAGTTLSYCGYLGGKAGGEDVAMGIVVDQAGNAYIAGYTDSFEDSFPVKTGPDLTYNLGSHDAFVVKLNATGTALVYCGYLGGNQDDIAQGIAVDSAGNAYLVGRTGRPSDVPPFFPVTVGPDLSYNGGDTDAFVAKVNAAGTALLYSGYIGGGGDDDGKDIAVGTDGSAYVTGITLSSQSSFPVRGGPDLTFNGSYDAFVAKVNPAGTDLTYCGYIGGSSDDYASSIDVDRLGNAYIGGYTVSEDPPNTFPLKVGPSLTFGGKVDGFVAKVNATGTDLVYCGYIGGLDMDFIYGLAVDGTGNAYVVGLTNSTQASFPVKVGPDLTYNSANSLFLSDGFVAKVNASGTALTYCGYIGGDEVDYAEDIAVDSSGNAYVVGHTYSTQATFPVTNSSDLTHNGGSDVFITKVNAAGTGLLYSGYLGGTENDFATGIAVEGTNAYVVGYTWSPPPPNLPGFPGFPVTVGPSLTYKGGADAFVAKIAEVELCPNVTLMFPVGGFLGSRVTINGSNFTGVTAVKFTNNVAATFSVDSATQITATVPNGAVTGPITLSKPSCPDERTPSFAIPQIVVSGISTSSGAVGSQVIITGSGFTGVTAVRFTGNVAAQFTVNNDTQITVIVPAGALTGPITISRPGYNDAQTQPFTVPPPCLPVSLPTNLAGAPGSALTAPIQVGDTTGKGVLAYDVVLTFNSAVLRLADPPTDKAGTLSAALTVTANSPAAGQLRISAFGPTALTGAGTLLNLKFVVIGTAPSCSDLVWTSFRFNEGIPCATTTNGRACVTAGGTLSGAVSYCITPKPVPGVTLNVTGSSTTSTTTDASGNYRTPNLQNGNYTLTPTKTGDVNGVNSFDAALVAQSLVGLITLTSCQQLAGDTSDNDVLSSFDAALISQYVVGITNPQSIAGRWKFVPLTRSYSNLSSDQTNQNFDAVLVGDVSGNWAAGATAFDELARASSPAQQVSIALPNLTPTTGTSVTIPITVGDLTGKGVIAYDFDLVFDPSVLQAQLTPYDAAGTLSSALTITANPQPGRLRVSAFGTQSLTGAGTLLNLKFNVLGAGGTGTALTWQRFLLNETVQTNLTNGRVNVGYAVACVSAASFMGAALASESIVAGFGQGLATRVETAATVPLPTVLAGTTLRVRDSTGLERLAPLFFVAPQQVNYQVPPGTAPGLATILITSGDGAVSTGAMSIARVAPGLFAANANGQGVAAAVALRVKADGSQLYEFVSTFDAAQQRYVPLPLSLGPEGEQLYLLLFGTGVRNYSNLANVQLQVGGVSTPVPFIGGVEGLVGLDQLNVGPLPRTLAGRGEVNIAILVDGQTANVVTVNIR